MDFACHSELMQDRCQYTNEQFIEIYRCIHETLNSGCPMTEERLKMLMGAIVQIKCSVDDPDECVEQFNQRELELTQGQTDKPTLRF